MRCVRRDLSAERVTEALPRGINRAFSRTHNCRRGPRDGTAHGLTRSGCVRPGRAAACLARAAAGGAGAEHRQCRYAGLPAARSAAVRRGARRGRRASPARTQPGHLRGSAAAAALRAASAAPRERAPDGNAVSLDEEADEGRRDRDGARSSRDESLHEIPGHVPHRARAQPAQEEDRHGSRAGACASRRAGMDGANARGCASSRRTSPTRTAPAHRRAPIPIAARPSPSATGWTASSATETVRVKQIGTDTGEFPLRYEPAHPAADAEGYVKTPNVNSFVEVMDMREAQRSYSANLPVLETTRGMLTRTIEHVEMSRDSDRHRHAVRGGRGLCARRPAATGRSGGGGFGAAAAPRGGRARSRRPPGGCAGDEGDCRRGNLTEVVTASRARSLRCNPPSRSATASCRPIRTSCVCRSDGARDRRQNGGRMAEADVASLVREAMLVMLKLGGPPLLVGLAVGLVVSCCRP